MSEQSALADNPAQRLNFEQDSRRHPVSDNEEREVAAQVAAMEHYASVIGAFQDDPMLDAMMANIRERRREMDADDLTE